MTSLSVDLATFSGEREIRLPLREGPIPLGAGIVLAEPVEIAVHLSGTRDRMDVEVAADLVLVAPCDRCLDEVRFRLPVRYAEEWESGGALQEADVILDGPVLRRHVTEARVDLADGFWQNAALELPAKVLCHDGCRGICPTCGANRNHQACTCDRAERDPRLAALADWRPQTQAPDNRPR